MNSNNPTGIWTTSREGNVYVTILKDDAISVLENVSKKIAATAIESIQTTGQLDAGTSKVRSHRLIGFGTSLSGCLKL